VAERPPEHRFAKWFSPDEVATLIALDARDEGRRGEGGISRG
jgi:hypothetical protein